MPTTWGLDKEHLCLKWLLHSKKLLERCHSISFSTECLFFLIECRHPLFLLLRFPPQIKPQPSRSQLCVLLFTILEYESYMPMLNLNPIILEYESCLSKMICRKFLSSYVHEGQEMLQRCMLLHKKQRKNLVGSMFSADFSYMNLNSYLCLV